MCACPALLRPAHCPLTATPGLHSPENVACACSQPAAHACPLKPSHEPCLPPHASSHPHACRYLVLQRSGGNHCHINAISVSPAAALTARKVGHTHRSQTGHTGHTGYSTGQTGHTGHEWHHKQVGRPLRLIHTLLPFPLFPSFLLFFLSVPLLPLSTRHSPSL